MLKKINILMLISFFSLPAYADVTAIGKIVSTQGHYAPSCRVVAHKENESGTVKYFRILDVPTDDHVGSVILSALISNRDVTIDYIENEGSGCGSEPKIRYVTIF